MRPDPLVSIIICTRNRAESLRETLATVGRVRVPEDLPAELLVVDNGSSDNTRQVAEQAGLPNMPVRYVHEPRKGKGYAYNTGMAEAKGDIFLFTDDDCRVPEDWIEGMCRPIMSGEADAVAGAIILAPHLMRPWMTPLHLGWLAHWPDVGPATEAPDLVGANMAFHRRVPEAVGGFDVALGPGALGFGDDTLLGWQALKAGFRIAGSPSCVVHHFDASRLARRYWLREARKKGASTAYIAYHWRHEPVPSLRRAMRARLRYLKWLALHLEWQAWREGAAPEQLSLLSDIAYLGRLREESRGPRRYDTLGLRPRASGVEAEADLSAKREANARD